jgi:glycerophosphoryl diester phosphodiesterase
MTPGTAPGGRPLVIAHRGASGHAPEHTLAAYDLAVRMGADVLEPDLQMTADGHLVAFHDGALDRTARGSGGLCTGPVRARTLTQLRGCEVGSWFNDRNPDRADPAFEGLRIPTLDELFGRYGASVRWYPETKSPEEAPGMEEALLALLDRHDLRDRAVSDGLVLIQSFSADSLRRLRALDPGLPLVQLLPRGSVTPDTLDTVLDEVAGWARGVGPNHALVDEAFMTAARARGLFVHPWTVNDPADMDRLLALGVDGIFSDFPDRLRERIEAITPEG